MNIKGTVLLSGMKPAVHVILTGGTIDSFFDATKDAIVPHAHSALPAFIKTLKLYERIEFTEVCMKDSRDITAADRKAILASIEKSPHTRIIITHGTYTMPDTARYLRKNTKSKKTIVLTGSFIPLTGFSPSDAPFSLGFALARVHDLGPGVYICMNGRVFSADEAAKQAEEGRFVSMFEPGRR